AHLSLALFYRQEDAHGRAYDEALAAARTDNKDAFAWRLAGVEAIELRRFDDAENALKRSISQNRKDWRSYVALGNALNAQNRDKQALECFREAVRLAPSEPSALNG